MGSDTQNVLPGKSEWQRAEQAIDRLIAAHQGLVRDSDSGSEAGAHSAAEAQVAALPSAQPSGRRWPRIVLLAALFISAGLVVSATIVSIAMLL